MIVLRKGIQSNQLEELANRIKTKYQGTVIEIIDGAIIKLIYAYGLSENVLLDVSYTSMHM